MKNWHRFESEFNVKKEAISQQAAYAGYSGFGYWSKTFSSALLIESSLADLIESSLNCPETWRQFASSTDLVVACDFGELHQAFVAHKRNWISVYGLSQKT